MNIARSFIALVCLFLFSACGSDSNPSDSGSNSEPPIAIGKLSFTVGSTTKTDDADATGAHGQNLTTVQTHVDKQSPDFSVVITLDGELKRGGYPVKESATTGEARIVCLYTQTPHIATSGTVNITVLTDTSIAGTFSFNGHDMNNPAKLLAVQNGKFHVRRP